MFECQLAKQPDSREDILLVSLTKVEDSVLGFSRSQMCPEKQQANKQLSWPAALLVGVVLVTLIILHCDLITVVSLGTQFNPSLVFFKLQLSLLTAPISHGQLCPLSLMEQEGTVSFSTIPWLCMDTPTPAPSLPPLLELLYCSSLWAIFGNNISKIIISKIVMD